MLGKLIKYETKATARNFLPIYIAILILAIIKVAIGDRVTTSVLGKIGNISMFVMFGLFVALVVITLIVIIQRFYTNLIKDEGYLMFTLPVKTWKLIISKLVVTVIWNICSVVVAVTTFLILISPHIDIYWSKDIWNVFRSNSFIILNNKNLIYFILAAISGYIMVIFMIYLSIAIGQIPLFNKYRVVASFITFFVLNLVINQLSVVYLVSFVNVINNNIESYMFLAGMSVWLGIVAIILFVVTNYVLNKQLNLE